MIELTIGGVAHGWVYNFQTLIAGCMAVTAAIGAVFAAWLQSLWENRRAVQMRTHQTNDLAKKQQAAEAVLTQRIMINGAQLHATCEGAHKAFPHGLPKMRELQLPLMKARIDRGRQTLELYWADSITIEGTTSVREMLSKLEILLYAMESFHAVLMVLEAADVAELERIWTSVKMEKVMKAVADMVLKIETERNAAAAAVNHQATSKADQP